MISINDFLQEKYNKIDRISASYAKKYSDFDYKSFEDAFQIAAEMTYKNRSNNNGKHLNNYFEKSLKSKYITLWTKARTKQYLPNCTLNHKYLINFWDHSEFSKEKISEVISDFTRLAMFDLNSFGGYIQLDIPKEMNYLCVKGKFSMVDLLHLYYKYKKAPCLTDCEIEKQFIRSCKNKKRIFVGINGNLEEKDFLNKFENNDYTKKKVKDFVFFAVRKHILEILTNDSLFNKFGYYKGTYIEGGMFLGPKDENSSGCKTTFGVSSLENTYWIAKKFYKDKPSYHEYIDYLEEKMAMKIN